MNRDFSKRITDLSGDAIPQGISVEGINRAINTIWAELSQETKDKLVAELEKAGNAPLTLASACCTALLAPFEDERSSPPPGDVRVKRYRLAGKIHAGGVVDITADERDMIKPLLFKAFGGSLIPVVAADLLETDVPAATTD